MENLTVKVENGVKALEIRQGEALKLREPIKTEIQATISAPLNWITQRKEQIDEEHAHVIINKDKGSIVLYENETNPYGAVITGELEISQIFKDFGINSGTYKTPLEMSEFVKMNRAYFENRTVAMELVTQLRSFRAKVDKQVEQDVNLNKGDKRLAMTQAVESNVPSSFKVCLPVFKGMDKITFEVETYFNPDDLTCTLVSPEANELLTEFKESAINQVASDIAKICPQIVIIEQ